MAGRIGPESPRERSGGRVTPATGGSPGPVGAGGPHNGPTSNPTGVVYPDVRLRSNGDVIVRRVSVESAPECPWVSTSGEWLGESFAAEAQRMVPVGPLLELVAGLEQAAGRAAELAEGVGFDGSPEWWADVAEGRTDSVDVLRKALRSLLGADATGDREVHDA